MKFQRIVTLKRSSFILGMLIAIATHAADPKPDPSCEGVLSPAAQISSRIMARKKSLTILTGDTTAIESMMTFVLQQLPPEFDRRSVFEITDHQIVETEFSGSKDSQAQPKENYAALKIPLEERVGKTDAFVGLILRDFLNLEFTEPTSRILNVSANQLSTRQQKELLEVYNSLPDDLDFHLMLFSTNEANIIQGFRAQTNAIAADSSGQAAYAEKRGTYLRQLVKVMLEPKEKPWGARVVSPTAKKTSDFATDMITLAQTLTLQDVQFFLMQIEPPHQEGNENRPAFVEMPGLAGTIQSGAVDSDLTDLSTWDDVVSSGPNKNNLRMVVIPVVNFTTSELYNLQKWIATLSNRKDGHLFRTILLMDK